MGSVESQVYQWLIVGGLVSAAAVFVMLLLIPAPYGRYVRGGWGPVMNNRAGWFFMEITSAVVFAGCFFAGHGFTGGVVWIFVVLYQAHYIHRSIIFPFRMRGAGRPMPVLIVFFGMVFNVYNGYINGRYLGIAGEAYTVAWLSDPRFLVGIALFLVGAGINFHADQVLFNLRKPGETDYKIPRGGMYRWISCPNYFGEILEWIGWAVMTWSLPGLVFAVWTAANLAPRAITHHKWYRATFPDYPRDRKALVPFIR
jgi:3-oxo-5-alpha-steroid 4-dehydrogenase 1